MAALSSSASLSSKSATSLSKASILSKKKRVYHHMCTSITTKTNPSPNNNNNTLGYSLPIYKKRNQYQPESSTTSQKAVRDKGLQVFLDAFYPPEEEEERMRLEKLASSRYFNPIKNLKFKRERKMIASCESCPVVGVQYCSRPDYSGTAAGGFESESGIDSGCEYSIPSPEPSPSLKSESSSSSPDSLESGFGGGKKVAVKTLAPFQKAAIQNGTMMSQRRVEEKSKKNDTRDLEESEFISGIVILLEQMILRNESFTQLPQKNNPISIFYSTLKQPFSMNYYIGRLVKHMACSRSIFIFALIYLERIKKMNYELRICDRNVHRVFIVACSVAAKFLEDECYCNEYYQKVGGVPTIKEFNKLEKQFLKTIGWNLNVGTQEFEQVEKYLFESIDIFSDCGDSE